jgi:hypothetical protein
VYTVKSFRCFLLSGDRQPKYFLKEVDVLTRLQSVLDLDGFIDENTVCFWRGDESLTRELRIAREDYEMMGLPSQVTVTVLPGDHLNEKGE